MRFTGVTAGAAVVSVITADCFLQRAAAPFVGLVHEAAGRVLGAAGLGVTHVLGRPSWTANSLAGNPLQGWYLLEPGEAALTKLVTSLLGNITLVAFGAAVLMIVTAHSLR